MIERKDWDEFRSTGLVVFINQILHVFGWAICFDVDDRTGKCVSVFPVRTKFRGFGESDQTESYQRITRYMKDNIDELSEEVKE